MAIEIHQLTVNSSIKRSSEESEDKKKADKGNARDSHKETEENFDRAMINSMKKELAEECRRIIVNCFEEKRSR
ncbi:hypothetical protein [Teredinibacter haidensis]|uniref:hypothetical protein n=1 Tax=Teredinibacter haidensis TaxID=2731755 RepID=UPI000948F7D0|nr:hypothetical protein [Teredinibacter haidensis]